MNSKDQGSAEIPGLESCGEPGPASLIYAPASYVEPMVLERLFRDSRPLEVELGSGDGGFILRWAGLHPGRNFLAVERLKGRMSKIDRKGRRIGLRNLRVMRIEAGYFLEYLLPRGRASAIHIYFPDPWPKRKHRQYRLINPRFAAVAAGVLAPEGRVYLRTDDADYFAQMRAVLEGAGRFDAVDTPEELAGVPTDFEREFMAQGIGCRRAAYQLRSDF